MKTSSVGTSGSNNKIYKEDTKKSQESKTKCKTLHELQNTTQ